MKLVNQLHSRIILAAVCLVLVASVLPAKAVGQAASGQEAGLGRGRVIEGLSLPSAVLGKSVAYSVYLPPDYDASARRYPVVYLLHGYTDDQSAWIQWGEINMAADKAINDRTMPAMIIVMPDGGVSWYMNDYAGKCRWEDMFIKEFVPAIDREYRTRPERDLRAVAGLSMGGWGTLLLVLRHPDMFAAGAAFSAAVWTDDEVVSSEDRRWNEMFAPLFGPAKTPKDRLSAWFRSYNPLDLVKNMSDEKLKTVRFWLDCGDDDFLFLGNAALHLAMRDRKVTHEFRVRDGGHTWSYWRTGIIDGLRYISESFHR